MKIRFLPLLSIALLLSVTTSEARSRRPPRTAPKRAAVTRDSGGSDEGGPLARSRGLSQAESAAAGAVLAEIASSSTAAADTAGAIPARRFSPDYYRAYGHRAQATGSKQRVAVKPPTPAVAPVAKPQAVAATPPVFAKPPVVTARRVVVAPVANKAPKFVPAPVVVVKPARVAQPQVTAAPPATGIRMAFAPRTAAVAKVPVPAVPEPPTKKPVRSVFR